MGLVTVRALARLLKLKHIWARAFGQGFAPGHKMASKDGSAKATEPNSNEEITLKLH